jgi:TolB-like protein/Flp pilus assembly protein TadD/predicted Ser/Thr protein kinase
MIRALKTCRTCGLEIPADAPEGACPGCLLESGLAALLNGEEEIRGETESPFGVSTERVSALAGEFGDYVLLEEIGRGGQGIVYLARQKSLNRTVALKVLTVGRWASRADLKRFRREAAAAASLDHPRIVPIYEVGERDGSCYFSMKFVEGGQLDEVVSRAPMSMRQAAEVIAKVARTVHYAHQHGILHRDIKPGNILLDTNGEPHLTDFGLARLVELEGTVTDTEYIMGTPSYMAPEQAVAHKTELTSTTDVYGVGAVLYQLLTSHPPFAAETTYETIRLLVETDAREPRLLNSKIDRELSTICLKCLEKDPKRRYPSALALAEDLEHWLKHEPIQAKRSGFVAHAHKWVQRNPAIAALVVSLVALAAAIGWNIWKSDLFFSAPEKSIAVLPFENLSRDPDNAFFADGVQDEILTNLARVADLKVVGRTSVMQYKTGVVRDLHNIGQRLGVANVLEGSVRRSGNRVRVNAQLVDVRSQQQLWAQTYDRDLVDVFAMQTEIAENIVAQLKGKLSPQEKEAIEQRPTADLAAYDLYVRAKPLILSAIFSTPLQESLFEAVRMLNQAIELDPAFALAYYQLAHAQDVIYFSIDHTPARRAMADAAIQSLTRLRPNSGEAHLALARHFYWADRDYARARTELSLALKTLPNEPLAFAMLGFIDRRQGRWAESTKNLERAIELDPQHLFLLTQLANSYLCLRRYGDAEQVLDRAIALHPTDSTTRAFRSLTEHRWHADPQPAISTVEAIVAKNPLESKNIAQVWLEAALCVRDFDGARHAVTALPFAGCYEDTVPFPRAWCEGVVARAAGDTAAARAAFNNARLEAAKLVAEQPNYAEALCVLGMADAALGNKEDAIREGRRAVELLPVTKDAIIGPQLLQNLALIYAWTGEKDLALKQLGEVTRLSGYLNYGELRLHPRWDPLRGDPRFEQIVASLAPRAATESASDESRSALRRSDSPR